MLHEKWKSRKFIVWTAWLVISITSLFVHDLPKEIIFQYFGIISMVYIGSNAAQKFMPQEKKCGEN